MMGDAMKYYFNVFIIYSMIGYIWETLFKVFGNEGINNGFLYGPWIPVYGFGCCLIIFIMRLVFNRIKTSRLLKIILVFIISTCSLTFLEYLGGNLIEIITGETFWDYSNLKYNYGNYIALEISLAWGFMAIFLIYFIKPIVDKIIKKIPSILTYLVLLTIFMDFVITLILI